MYQPYTEYLNATKETFLGSAKSVGEFYKKASEQRQNLAQSLMNVETSGYAEYYKHQLEQAKDFHFRRQELITSSLDQIASEYKRFASENTSILKDQRHLNGDAYKEYLGAMNTQGNYWYSLVNPATESAAKPASEKTTPAIEKTTPAIEKAQPAAKKTAAKANAQLTIPPAKADKAATEVSVESLKAKPAQKTAARKTAAKK